MMLYSHMLVISDYNKWQLLLEVKIEFSKWLLLGQNHSVVTFTNVTGS